MELKEALELRKARYLKRWKGKDGKWVYKYPSYYKKKGSKQHKHISGEKRNPRTGASDIDTLSVSVPYKNSELYSQHQKTMIGEYKDTSYLDTNDFLRGHLTKEQIRGSDYDVPDTIKTLDSAFKSSRVFGADIELMRGGDFETRFSVGDEINDGGYLSTAITEEAAANFASNATDPTMFKLVVPKGTPYMVMGTENEILLPRENKLRITKVTNESFIGSGGGSFKAQTVYAVLERK